MKDTGFLVNPPGARLWGAHAVMNGRSRHHDVDRFVGPVSVKTVLNGSATWETARGRFTITPETYLVLGEGEEYSLRIRSEQPVETFCVFLREGTLSHRLTPRVDLLEGSVADALAEVRRLTVDGPIESMEADAAILDVASALDGADRRATNAAERLSRRPESRVELRRRLDFSREWMLFHSDRRISVDELASRAFMSTYHFHRLFRQAFGESPHATLTRVRISRAKRLLREGMDVGSVASESGFESVPTFCRLFKSRVGTSPAQFSRIG